MIVGKKTCMMVSGFIIQKKNLRREGTVIWRCTIRPKMNPSKGMISYNNNSYSLFVCHTCTERKEIAVKAAVTTSAKEKPLDAVDDSAMQILKPILVDQLEKKGCGVQLFNPNLVVRSMKRGRQNARSLFPHLTQPIFSSMSNIASFLRYPYVFFLLLQMFPLVIQCFTTGISLSRHFSRCCRKPPSSLDLRHKQNKLT